MFASHMSCFKRCFEAAQLFGAPPHSTSSVLEPQQHLPRPCKRIASICFTYSNWKLCFVVLKAGQNNRRKKEIYLVVYEPNQLESGQELKTQLSECPEELEKTADASVK